MTFPPNANVTSSIMGSDIESEVHDRLTAFIANVNCRLVSLGFKLTLSHNVAASTVLGSKERLDRSINSTNFDSILITNPKEMKNNRFLSIQSRAVIKIDLDSGNLLWAINDDYVNRRIWDIPENYLRWVCDNWDRPPIPEYIQRSIEEMYVYQKEGKSADDWEEWFMSTYGILEENVNDVVEKYIMKTSLDFVIEISGRGENRRPVFVVELDGVGSGFIKEGDYFSMPRLQVSYYNWSRKWKYQVKNWLFRTIGLPLLVIPPVGASKIGLNNTNAFIRNFMVSENPIPYCGVAICRAVSDFIITNMEQLNANKTGFYDKQLDRDLVLSTIQPFGHHWPQLENFCRSRRYEYSINSHTVTIDEMKEANIHQFVDFLGEDYWRQRIPDESDDLGQFDVEGFIVHTLSIIHPIFGPIEQSFWELPFETSQPLPYASEMLRGFLAAKIDHFQKASAVDILPFTLANQVKNGEYIITPGKPEHWE